MYIDINILYSTNTWLLPHSLNTNCFDIVYLQAISNPSDEALQDLAWNSVLPLVGKLKRFYEYALELGKGCIDSSPFTQIYTPQLV